MSIARLLSILALVAGLGAASAAVGQEVIVYSPIEETVVTPAPAMVYDSTPVYAGRPVVVDRAPVYVERPVVVQNPPVTVYRPIAPAPVVRTYSPTVTTYSPVVTTYSPVVQPAPAYVVGRPVVWQAEYVPGQPVRNVLRAVLP